MVEIVTERLRWRPTRAADFKAMHACMSDFEVVRNLSSWPWPPDPELTASRCVPVAADRGLAGSIFLADGTYVGGMGIVDGSMGYGFARSFWGRGYATEMGHALIRTFFDGYPQEQITAQIWTDNTGSQRVLTKLGFEATGTQRDMCAARGELVDGIDFCLTRDRWERLSNRPR